MICKKNVAHLTSAHPRYDTRIFLKECISLVNNGYNVSLVVADGLGDEEKDGVSILDVGEFNGRLNRMRNAPHHVLVKAINLDADIYHLHDPELLPIGLKLKRMGKCVIFDAHEDVPKQILGKPYLNKLTKFFISNLFSIYERWATRQLDMVVAATPFIRDKFLAMKVRSVDINNFPLLGELDAVKINWNNKKNKICYIGGISKIRGIFEMIKALDNIKSDVRLELGGFFSEPDVKAAANEMSGWQRVDELGWLDRNGVQKVLLHSIAGLVTLHPVINYTTALPVKMFEYMAAGVPVIASDFPLWNDIVLGNSCGLCVDPLNPVAIAAAIDYFANNPLMAEEMGRNGQKAIYEKYNWQIEEIKILKLYKDMSVA